VDLVCPSSVTATEHIRTRYGVPHDRARTVSWGVDTRLFAPAPPERRLAVLSGLGIDPNAAVVVNVRRFKPGWGCREALAAYCLAAEAAPQAHFLLLGGPDTAGYVAEARTVLAERRLQARFTFIEGQVPIERCAELMSAADVASSLMQVPDMRSSSILQAAACGSALVLSDQREYRAMAELGFRATLVDPTDASRTAEQIVAYVGDPERRGAEARANAEFVASHEQHDRQMDALLDLIEAACEGRLAGHSFGL
jgi:glycosyltransferase involved in cell wall biosynthesis